MSAHKQIVTIPRSVLLASADGPYCRTLIGLYHSHGGIPIPVSPDHLEACLKTVADIAKAYAVESTTAKLAELFLDRLCASLLREPGMLKALLTRHSPRYPG